MKIYAPYKRLPKTSILYLLFTLVLSLASINLFSQKKNPLNFVDNEKLQVQGHVQFGVNVVGEENLFWNLADVPTFDFNSDTQWLESYLKPGVDLQLLTGRRSVLYGKLSAVASYTWGQDAFDAKNTGRITLEEAYVGFKYKLRETTQVDVSLGSRELQLGTGMLIANGGSSGFERGALKFGPRKAWQKAAIGVLQDKNLRGLVYYLEPNELPSNNTHTELTGADINYSKSADEYLGLTYIHVPRSDAPYPKAAPNGIGPTEIIAGGRKGLNALNLYAKARPFNGDWNRFFVALDAAYEWNQRIDMRAWGGRTQLGYDFSNVGWEPSVMYSYQVFSGDNPNTVRQERFDPLYFEGSPDAWSTGSKSSMIFINSNVQAHGITLQVTPTQKSTLTLRYTHILAQKLLSPIQFGQADRVVFFEEDVPTVISGATHRNLADDMFLEYNYAINPHIYLTAGFSVSFPRKGIRSLGGHDSTWAGGFVNVVFNY